MELKFSNDWLKRKIAEEADCLDVDCGLVEFIPKPFDGLTPDQIEIELLRTALGCSVERLKAALSCLKAYEEGIKPSEAKEGEKYFCINGGRAFPVEQCSVTKKWLAPMTMLARQIEPDRLYPLPPTEQKGGE